jgi:CTP:molybdopterin cytidylyltransferase MocA
VTACILLASGYGRRFGGNKLMAPVAGKPLYRHTLELLLGLPDTKTIVVSQYADILQDAAQNGADTVLNSHPEEGIAASVRLGTAAAGDADWYAFFVADQPDLRLETVCAFLGAAQASGKTLATVVSGNVPGNPTLFHRCWRSALCALQGDRGGRRILNAHPDQVFSFSVPAEELRDVDTREALLQVQGKSTS